MIRARVGVSLLVVSAGAIAATLGVTWASDSTPPRLERSSSAVLFDDVALAPAVPVVRCASLVPRGASLDGLAFDGHASGALTPAVRIRVERGAGEQPAGTPEPDGCGSFVPIATVYDGPLDGLPPETTRTTVPVAIDVDRPIRYRATLTLSRPDTGSTAFGLRITGLFADAPAPPPPRPVSPEDAKRPPPPLPCLQPQSGNQVQRTAGTGAMRLVVRTPQALPLQVVRPLPVYVTTSARTRPTMLAGGRSVPLGRTSGGRWIGHVSVAALSRSQGVRVTSGRATVFVPIANRPCVARIRTFLRTGGTVDLRVDTRQSLSGMQVRLPAVLGRLAGGTLAVRDTDDRGRTRSARGSVGSRGRIPTSRLPRVRITGRTIEVLDLPSGVRTLSLRLKATGVTRARRELCPREHATVGRLTTVDPKGALRTDAIRSPLRLIGDRCPRD